MIIPFPSSSPRSSAPCAQRREVAAIPVGYRLRNHTIAQPMPSDQLLSSLWPAIVAVLLFCLALGHASAAPSTTASASTSIPLSNLGAPTSTATSSAPNSLPPPMRHVVPASAASSTSATADDIRDIHTIVHITPSWMWLVYAVGVLALGAGLYFLTRYLSTLAGRRSKRPGYELVLEALEKARSLMKPETMREYSYRVSEIIRVYIEEIFNARAAHRTTEEFLHDLVEKPSGGLAAYSDSLENFLKHCDLVKFARWTLTQEEMEQMHESAVNFVNQTRPRTKEEIEAELAQIAKRNGTDSPQKTVTLPVEPVKS